MKKILVNQDVSNLIWSVKHKHTYYRYTFLKRLIDIAGAISGIVLLFPLFILISILIKLDSQGPIFFIQKRCGKNEKLFNMYKFRSMCINAEDKLEQLQHLNETEGVIFKIKDDPRLTKVGKFIRKTSIDELPQLVNVLKGEMSLVGPRPPLPNEVKQYKSWQKLKLSVKPGLTGLWQISGRSELGFDEMIKLDLEYIAKRSLVYDIWIILKTIPVVFQARGAY
ncbi:MAG: sugar transferase [Deltaproteobacteria bacterium]